MSVSRELLKLKPHIFANGGDRYKKNIPETATCKTIDCRMVFNIGESGKIQSSSWLLNNYKKKVNEPLTGLLVGGSLNGLINL